MESLASTGSTLSSCLSEPLASTSQLLELVVPPLAALGLLPEASQLPLSNYRNSQASEFDPKKFLKRQFGLVQKVLIEKVWPDWEQALETELGTESSLVFTRWFIPPSASSSSSEVAGIVFRSSYGVLTSLLSTQSVSTLQPRSLDIIAKLLLQLHETFSLAELYMPTFASPRSSAAVQIGDAQNSDVSDDDDDDDIRIDPARLALWERLVKDLVSVPARIANAFGLVAQRKGFRAGQDIPSGLELESFMATLTRSYLSLCWALSSPDPTDFVYPSALAIPLQPLVSSPSFLASGLPVMISRILPPAVFPTPARDLLHRQKHINLLQGTISAMPDRDTSKLLRSTLSKLTLDLSKADAEVAAKSAAFVLSSLFGPLDPASSDCRVATDVLLDKNCTWDAQVIPRVVLFWLEGREDATVALLDKVVELWGSSEELRSGFEARRLYLTALVLVLVVSLPRMHKSIIALSKSPLFLNAVSSSLSTISPLSRLLGMLVAEFVSNRSIDPQTGVQPLDFGTIWDGQDEAKIKIRDLRELVSQVESGSSGEGWKELLKQVYVDRVAEILWSKPRTRHNSKPVQATSIEEPVQPLPKRPLISIINADDEDDDAALPAYPLPPAASEATIEALSSSDPSLYRSAYSATSTHPSQSRRRGQLRPPVYIFELTEYLRGKDPDGLSSGQNKEEADQEAERVEMGLKQGEALIRRKAGWGNELKENAVNLAIALMSLQDNYELDQFEQLRQNLLVALISSCPIQVAPCVIEQYFMPSYSISQLDTFLTSLALAAREIANLPIPSINLAPKPASSPEALFPSKQLPPALHRRLLASQQPTNQLQLLAADLTNLALTDAREDAETSLPGAAKEKLLSVRKFNTKSAALSRNQTNENSTLTYTSICAETFILPLLNRFWLYLRDTATLTLYSSDSNTAKGPYGGGASSTPILQPLLLSKYLATVSILLHAARHAPTFLAVLAPEALALVVSLRPPVDSDHSNRASLADEPGLADLDLVLAGEMELILLILSTSYSIDAGHTLTQSSFELLSETQSWAEEVFEQEETKSGGAAIGRSGRAAAGILLRLEEILGRWRGRVGWE